jgi:hypothetical protein
MSCGKKSETAPVGQGSLDASPATMDGFKSVAIGLDKDVLSLHSKPVSYVFLYKGNDKSNGVRIGIPPGELVDISALPPFSLEVAFAFMIPNDGHYRTFSTSYGNCKDIEITEKTQTPFLVRLDSFCENPDPTTIPK